MAQSSTVFLMVFPLYTMTILQGFGKGREEEFGEGRQ